jgi:hypothetical protein
VHVPALRHGSPRLAHRREPVALDHRHGLEALGEHTRGQEPGHAATDHHGVLPDAT